MKFTYNWLKDFANIKIAPSALAEKLTMAGLEVTSVRKLDSDFVFEAEVTSNRPDLLSILGIAREIAAITSTKLKPGAPKPKIKPGAKSAGFKIAVTDKKDCPLYTARIIRGVKVGPSPAWLRERLEAVGCRSINNIVDITNYFLFQYGQPLHAFDWDKLQKGGIVVRRAAKNESITTIDGDIKELIPEILVITDDQKAVAIAGIMGGADTEVSDNTQNILLEAAVFDPVVVRRGRCLLGLDSESAYRFERGVDLNSVEEVSLRATGLIQELAGGNYYLAAAAGLRRAPAKKVNLNCANVKRLLGIEIAAPRIKKILSGLGLTVKSLAKDRLDVAIPSYRRDLNTAIDLIEEIARIFGYENIPTTVPAVANSATLNTAIDLVSMVKGILVGLGSSEVTTYSLIDKKSLQDAGISGADTVEIRNPLSREQEILRPTLIPSLMRCVSYNLNQKQNSISIFEVAKVFCSRQASPKEELVLGFALCGTRSWLSEQGLVKDNFGVLHLKGITETLLQRLGINDYSFVSKGDAVEVLLGEQKLGTFLKPAREIRERFDIKNKEVVIAQLSLETIFKSCNLARKFSPLPLYPGIFRDLSLILKEDVLAQDLLATIRQQAGNLLETASIIDYYRGKQIPPGYKGLTISCFYRSPERTLTEEQVNPLHASTCRALEERFSARLR